MTSYMLFTNETIRHDMMMNLFYALTAVCIIYKLAALAIYLAKIQAIPAIIGRAGCMVVGTIVFFKASGRFHGGDTAQWLDITRELAWCGLLYAIIILVRNLTCPNLQPPFT